jgi:hypoxanthine phosphoribosyltransferase
VTRRGSARCPGAPTPEGAAAFLDREEIAEAVGRLGEEISAAYPEGLVLVGVLDACVVFMADLVRRLSVPCRVDFMALSAYRPGSSRVRIVKDLDSDIQGEPVLLVETLVDTGLTCSFVMEELKRRDPAGLELCALLDRVGRRVVPLRIAFGAFEAPGDMLVGYGLSFSGRYANLSRIVAVDQEFLVADQNAYVKGVDGR